MTTWFLLLSAFGLGGLLLGQQELAFFSAVAGLFVASQAADLDARWRLLHYALSWVVPAAAAAVFVLLAMTLGQGGPAGAAGLSLTGLCYGAALASVLTYLRPFSNALSSALFRGEPPSHTLRLSARIVFGLLLFAVPGWFAVRGLMDTLEAQIGSFVESASLGTGLVGYVLLALASVGFLLRRNLPEALTRLGIRRLTTQHLLVVVTGVIGLYFVNGMADLIQQRFFHALWLEDQRINEAIGGHLGLGSTIVLGLSAGIGEEITLRGALQPKLGLMLTSLLFAALHVQYSWFGIAVILLLGMILGLIRQRANTTAAIAVHALYDMAAVLSVGLAK